MDPDKMKSLEHSIIVQPEQFDQVRELLRTQKIMLTMLQPNKRSFSNPELHVSFKTDDIHPFRQMLISQNFNMIKNTQQNMNSIKCDNQNNECDYEAKPTPIPRRSRKKLIARIDSDITSASSNTTDSKNEDAFGKDTDTVSYREIPETNGSSVIDRNCNFISAPTLISTSKSLSSEKVIDIQNPNLIQKSFEQIARFPIEMPTIKTPIKIKNNKNSFRSFLKMNKIKSNKFLSLRNKISNGRKSLLDNGTPVVYKSQKPSRNPPPPPILIFRPAAPLPEQTVANENETYSDLNESSQTYPDSDAISELYHDAANLYDVEGIYYSVDDENIIKTNDDGNDDYAGAQTNNHCSTNITDHKNTTNQHQTSSDNGNYYDDGLCIYEELSSNDGTIYEEYEDDDDDHYDNAIYDNSDCFVDVNWSDDKKGLKQLKKLDKVMKRFNLNGEEVPVNAGIVKEDCKGTKNDLYVQKGETVLIIRMENNPPGKWLAKNERSKIGYIDLNNVFLETDSIKAAFKSFNSI